MPITVGMNEEAKKVYFCARALEKRNAKRTQYKVDQVHADDEYSGNDQDAQEDQEDYLVANDDMTNWTREDWIDYQNGSFVPSPRSDFGKVNTIQYVFVP
jgi:hypothetical protein